MDKLTFRRKCLEDPNIADPEFRDAWRNDPELEAFRQSVIKTDDQLLDALDVTIPSGLAARLELGCLLDESCRSGNKSISKWSRTHLALAASFVLATVVGTWAFSGKIFGLNDNSSQVVLNVVNTGNSLNGDIDRAYFEQVNLQIAAAVLDHAGHEKWGSLRPTVEKHEYFTELLVEYELPGAASNFSAKYAEHCPVMGQRALHALLKGKNSDVTLVVLPEHMTDLISELRLDDYIVHVQPFGSGTLVLSSESQADLNQSLSLLTAKWPDASELLALSI